MVHLCFLALLNYLRFYALLGSLVLLCSVRFGALLYSGSAPLWYSRHSYGALFHFLVRGRVNICVGVIVVVISIIAVLAVFLVKRSVGGIAIVVVGPILGLKERVSVSVSYVNARGIATGKTMHAVSDVLCLDL